MDRRDFRWSRDGLVAAGFRMPFAGAGCWGGSPPSRAPVSRPDQKNGSYLPQCLAETLAAHIKPQSCHGGFADRQANSAGGSQLLHFFRRQLAKLAGRHVEFQRAVAYALDFLHRMANRFKHAPNLAIAALNQRDLIPRIGCFLDDANAGWSGADALAVVGSDRHSGAQLGNRV